MLAPKCNAILLRKPRKYEYRHIENKFVGHQKTTFEIVNI